MYDPFLLSRKNRCTTSNPGLQIHYRGVWRQFSVEMRSGQQLLVGAANISMAGRP